MRGAVREGTVLIHDVCLSVCLFVCLSVCLFVGLFVCLFVVCFLLELNSMLFQLAAFVFS